MVLRWAKEPRSFCRVLLYITGDLRRQEERLRIIRVLQMPDFVVFRMEPLALLLPSVGIVQDNDMLVGYCEHT